jgi:hypothetical protein
MRSRTRHFSFGLAMTMARLTAASWETILRRSVLMSQGTCSPAEYWRMTAEKAAALQTSTRALLGGKGPAAMLAPFVSRARANAKRLRKRP